MATVLDVDSGDWTYVDLDMYQGWELRDGVLHSDAQYAQAPLSTGDTLLQWPEGAGVEYHVTLPFQGPAWVFTFYTSYAGYTQIVFEAYWTQLRYAFIDSISTATQGEKNVDTPPAYGRIYRLNNCMVLEYRASLDDEWAVLYQSPEIPTYVWDVGWSQVSVGQGITDWHYIRGVTVAGADALQVRMPDNTWQLVGVANNPIYLRIQDGDTQKWVAYAGGGGPDLDVRAPGDRWAKVSSAGGVYGILRGVLKKGGVPLVMRPVWINRKSDSDYSVPLPGYQTVTDDKGRFEISGFPLGDDYHMRVQINDLSTGGFYFTSTVDDPLAIASVDYP